MGINGSAVLKKRTVLLQETVAFLTNLRIELLYSEDSLIRLLRRMSELSMCRNLDYISLCLDLTERGGTFSESWKTALQSSRILYTREEKSKLSSLGELLGTTDAESQSTILNLYIEYFRQFLEGAEAANERYSRLFSALGFVSGFGIFIMVL